MALVIMISFLLIAGRSSGRLPMKNSLFIAPDHPSAFDPNLNSMIDDDSALHTPHGHVEKDAVVRDQEIIPRRISSAKSASNENKVSFRLSPNFQKTDEPQYPGSDDNSKGVFNLLAKGSVTPSGPLALNGVILKSHHSHGDDHVQQEKKNKRKLGSTPSPGGGH